MSGKLREAGDTGPHSGDSGGDKQPPSLEEDPAPGCCSPLFALLHAARLLDLLTYPTWPQDSNLGHLTIRVKNQEGAVRRAAGNQRGVRKQSHILKQSRLSRHGQHSGSFKSSHDPRAERAVLPSAKTRHGDLAHCSVKTLTGFTAPALWAFGSVKSLSGGCPLHCRVFSSDPGLHRLETSSTPPSTYTHSQMCQPKPSPGTARCALGVQNHPWLRSTVLGGKQTEMG